MLKEARALTLIEILVVLTIIGILAGIAFSGLSRGDTELRQASQNFALSVQKARSEAIRRGKYAGVNVTTYQFKVFEDTNNDRSYNTGEKIISRGNLSIDYPSVSLTSTSSKDIVFDPRGFVANVVSQTVTFSSSHSDFSIKAVISSQGRVRLEKVNN